MNGVPLRDLLPCGRRALDVYDVRRSRAWIGRASTASDQTKQHKQQSCIGRLIHWISAFIGANTCAPSTPSATTVPQCAHVDLPRAEQNFESVVAPTLGWRNHQLSARLRHAQTEIFGEGLRRNRADGESTAQSMRGTRVAFRSAHDCKASVCHYPNSLAPSTPLFIRTTGNGGW